MYSVKILKDSVPSQGGARLTTLEVTFPRCVLAEFNTHRVLSRNSASSRAIPIRKQIEMVRQDPFVPLVWTKNQSGMQGRERLGKDDSIVATEVWLDGLDDAIFALEALEELGVHKQDASRVLEPWMWHTVIVSSTKWNNFLSLRAPSAKSDTFDPETYTDLQFPADPKIQPVAFMMAVALGASVPKKVDPEDWHLPYIDERSNDAYICANGVWLPPDVLVSTGRCARVSYLTHDGEIDRSADISLAVDKLATNNHWSPWEHPAFNDPTRSAPSTRSNFDYPWTQARKFFPDESGE